MEEQVTPNPGSDEAIKRGCKCAVLDNYHGKGFPWGPDQVTSFWISASCQLHASLPVNPPEGEQHES